MRRTLGALLVILVVLGSGCLGRNVSAPALPRDPGDATWTAPRPSGFPPVGLSPAVEEYWFNGSFVAAAEPGAYVHKQFVENLVLVSKSARAIDVSLRWSSQGVPVDLDLVGVGPRWERQCAQSALSTVDCAATLALKEAGGNLFADYDGRFGAPDAPASLALASAHLAPANHCQAVRCPWTFAAYVDGVAGGVDFQMHITVHNA